MLWAIMAEGHTEEVDVVVCFRGLMGAIWGKDTVG